MICDSIVTFLFRFGKNILELQLNFKEGCDILKIYFLLLCG